MSAAEIIEEIRKLPASEQEQVLEFLQSERGRDKGTTAGTRYASDSKFEKAADKVFREHAELLRRLAK